MKRFNKSHFVYGGLFLIVLLVVSVLYSFVNSSNQYTPNSVTGNSIFAKSKMTEFDVQLAKKLMDKNNDGKCDYCGMDVNICIDSGMMECTMNPEAKIGILHSQHIHADSKVYINGEKIDFNQEKYFVGSAFVHIEPEANSEKTGDILHMHATGVPLWLFFNSIDMKFEKDCFTLDSAERYCNNNDKTLKFYVNGELNEEFGDYVFSDLDKILISYGDKNEDVSNQINSITSFSQNH